MYEVNLRDPMGLITVLRKKRLAECVLARVRFLFLYSIFTIVALALYYALLRFSIKLYCVLVELIIPHKNRLFEIRRLKGLRDESCGPSDRHLVTLPLWLATWGFRTLKRISKPQLNTVQFCTNRRSINQSLMKNFKFLDQRKQAKCSGYRIQTKAL